MLTLYAQLYQQEAELRLEARSMIRNGCTRNAVVEWLVQQIYTVNNVVLNHVDECDLNDDEIMKPLRQAQEQLFSAICEAI